MKRLAKIISFLFHPLLMFTYGVGLAMTCTFLSVYPPKMKALIIGGTFLSTAIFPAVFISLLVWSGAASDLELTNRKERVLPYLIFLCSALACVYFLRRLLLPIWLLGMMIGACVALLLTLGINCFWKISAHSIGIGGLIGGMMGVARILMINPYWAFIGAILVAGLLGTSRILLKKHTPMQVYAGFCLGFICTFVASRMGFLYVFM